MLKEIHKISASENICFQLAQRLLSDLEFIRHFVIAASKSIDSPRPLFREIKALGIASKMESPIYNRRNWQLFPFREKIRRQMKQKCNEFENYFVIDSKHWAVPKRANQKDYKSQFYLFRKYRKRIETLFAQLCNQFIVRSNDAASFHCFKTRILFNITARTTIQ